MVVKECGEERESLNEHDGTGNTVCEELAAELLLSRLERA